MDTTRVEVAAAILAGGQARRFGGRDKSRLVVEGLPIIIRQLAVLQPIASEVFVVGGDPSRFADVGLRVEADRWPGAGAIGGLATALDVATTDRVLVLACDLPFLHAGVLGQLVDRAAGHDGAWIRSGRGVEPFVACYRRQAREAIAAQIAAGDLRAAGLDAVLDMATLTAEDLAAFGPITRLLSNLNTPDEYARIE